MKLRLYQSTALSSFCDYFIHSDGSPLIVLPTGAGKSLVLAGLCHEILTKWPGQRILVLSHVQELVQQDFEKLKSFWSKAPAGIYSASIGKKQAHHPITFATIQSVYKKAHILGHRDLVFIDEAHLLSRKDSGMYNQLIAALKAINPRLKMAGLTATDYRLDTGKLTEGDDRIFTDVCYELPILHLIEEGYLTKLVSRVSKLQADLSRVGLTAGEFNSKQMEAAFDQDTYTSAVLDEVLSLSVGRKSMLFFCTGIDHANHVRDALRSRGVSAESVSSKTPKEERARILADYKAQKFRALCSKGILTTGFDAPVTDAIVTLIATMSPGLYVQIGGRGTRPLYASGYYLETVGGRLAAIAAGPKPNCLFLDYGNNITRHGAITHIIPPAVRKGRKSTVDAEKPTVRICEICRTASPLDVIECPECGSPLVKERDPLAKLEMKAADAEILMTNEQYLEANTVWADVDEVYYKRHKKEGKPDSIRVEYRCGLMIYKEWVCFDHGGYAAKKAAEWWQKRDADGLAEQPNNTEDALELCYCLATPVRIRVRKKEKLFEVIAHDFENRPARQGELAVGA